MQANKTVIINGRNYDAVTGLPVEETKRPTAEAKTTEKPAASIHATAQKSQTLHRRAVRKKVVAKRPQPGRHMDIARSNHVTKFAAHPITAPATIKKAAPEKPDQAPKTHPTVVRALERTSAKTQVISATPKQIKDAAIAKALAKETPKPAAHKKERRRWSRRFTVVTAVFSFLVIAAYFTYLNMPNLSVNFASAQAGIKASFPKYRPDGFSLQQPITFADGEVTVKFNSNTGNGGYAITQSRSSWDSSAVLDNVVRKNAGDNYVTTQERGLTIYSFDDNAVWVNGGIMYEIATDAPLSGEQIRRIATSL